MKYSSRQRPSKHWLRKIDWILVALLTILAIISVTTISSWVEDNIVQTLVFAKSYITY